MPGQEYHLHGLAIRYSLRYCVAVTGEALSSPRRQPQAFTTMTTTACLLAWALALLLLPALFIAHLIETDRERAQRWRAAGLSQRAIATRLNCSTYRVRKLLAA